MLKGASINAKIKACDSGESEVYIK